MNLPQRARWKTASYKEPASLEKPGIYELVPITAVLAGQRVVGTRSEQLLHRLKTQLMDRFGDVFRVLGMNVNCDR